MPCKYVHTCLELNITDQLRARIVTNHSAPINASVLILQGRYSEGGKETGTRGDAPTLRLTTTPSSTAHTVLVTILVESPPFKVPFNCVSFFWVVANKFTRESDFTATYRLLGTILNYL